VKEFDFLELIAHSFEIFTAKNQSCSDEAVSKLGTKWGVYLLEACEHDGDKRLILKDLHENKEIIK
jgi:hypothetical protein